MPEAPPRLLILQGQVLAKMDEIDVEKDEEGFWRPLYDGVRKTRAHEYDSLYGWVYWLIFNPQVNKAKITQNVDSMVDMAIVTAMSRADVQYWHKKIFACMQEKLSSVDRKTYNPAWMKASDACQREYVSIVEKIATDIYPKFMLIPQYQKI